jgi:GNAT superfamily N-acetyltransferase
MTIDYRRMRAEEEPAVLALWSQVFATPAAGYQAARFATDPGARAHTFVAVAPDAAVLAALHYRMAFRRDADGTPRPVGELDSVATRADARRQGHAGRLISLALEALRDAGCDWALLVATGEASRLYERYGWRCYPETWRRGTIAGALPQDDGRYLVRPFDVLQEPAGWERIAAVDVAFNRGRPLTVVRDAAYWRDYAALRVGAWIAAEGLTIFAAFRPPDDRRLCAYAMAEFYPSAFQVRDMAVLPEERDAALPLLASVAVEAGRRGIPLSGRLYVPQEPAIDAALDRLFGPTLHAGQDRGQLMA